MPPGGPDRDESADDEGGNQKDGKGHMLDICTKLACIREYDSIVEAGFQKPETELLRRKRSGYYQGAIKKWKDILRVHRSIVDARVATWLYNHDIYACCDVHKLAVSNLFAMHTFSQEHMLIRMYYGVP